ncbi:protein-tyrosine phosphatase family protein [Halopenitus persicus]|uniref:Histidinol-phosphate aminotransferase/protein phosphatase n=1 Tax=Halopenitus persicus TaxID=1048396 RepID=A0A1H3HGC4_9EURY|nr:dual specificity protein phosphatase [Halopenitus persicus]QHS15983.1 dual specificity protein phosphatase family protein [haloarchaeon 3A1-DGR]SDY14512.1 histidinol-phosphate aminotransferase/protein phosphatase [Halopenitus persicus]
MDEVADGILVGTEADAADGSSLRAHEVDAVVSLTHHAPSTGTVPRIDVPMADGPRNEYDAFVEAVTEVVTRRESGDRVLVHCSAGASRSPSVAAAAAAQLTGIGLEETFNRIIDRRPEVDPHDALVRRAVRYTHRRSGDEPG